MAGLWCQILSHFKSLSPSWGVNKIMYLELLLPDMQYTLSENCPLLSFIPLVRTVSTWCLQLSSFSHLLLLAGCSSAQHSMPCSLYTQIHTHFLSQIKTSAVFQGHLCKSLQRGISKTLLVCRRIFLKVYCIRFLSAISKKKPNSNHLIRENVLSHLTASPWEGKSLAQNLIRFLPYEPPQNLCEIAGQ